jgi:hypothetical protein
MISVWTFVTDRRRWNWRWSLARDENRPQRFGHMLILKLAHGLLSWLGGAETAVKAVHFAFPRPDFSADYAVVFPCPVAFDAAHTSILFDPRQFNRPIARSPAEASVFLQRAPLDWIFTGSRVTHKQPARSRLSLRSGLAELPTSGCGQRVENDAPDAEPSPEGRRDILSGHKGRIAPRHRYPGASARHGQHRTNRL